MNFPQTLYFPIFSDLSDSMSPKTAEAIKNKMETKTEYCFQLRVSIQRLHEYRMHIKWYAFCTWAEVYGYIANWPTMKTYNFCCYFMHTRVFFFSFFCGCRLSQFEGNGRKPIPKVNKAL